jgi:electron transport complex protein RnfG
MKEILRYGIILGVICLVASGLLAGVNSFTKSRIIAQAQQEEEASLKEVVPEAVHFEAVRSGNDIIYYRAHDKNAKLVGFAFKASGKGYSSEIETMVGMAADGSIIAIKILSQNETPGLGARVIEPSFTRQFANKNIQHLNEVQAITGATISSKAVLDAVKKKAQNLQALIKNEK